MRNQRRRKIRCWDRTELPIAPLGPEAKKLRDGNNHRLNLSASCWNFPFGFSRTAATSHPNPG